MLRATNLSKSYNSTPVLENVSIELNPSEVLFLTGPSGVGKSTALRLIANLDPSDSGHVTLDGRKPSEAGFSEWRRDVMYVPQHRITANCTPHDTFLRALGFRCRGCYGREAEIRAEEYVAICMDMGLEQEHIVRHRWSELSGGQAQRACVALCIALKPKVLLLDEPSSSCDHQSALLVEKAIINSGIASIWVSHDVGQPQRVGGRVQRMFAAV